MTRAPKVGADDRRVAHDGRRRAIGQGAALVEDDDTRRKLVDDAQEMLDEHDRDPGRMDPPDDLGCVVDLDRA
jgi:hypothetical protein